MRALVFTNLYPSAGDPTRGVFVRDQVDALRQIAGLELELFTFSSLGPGGYLEAARTARRRYRGARFDVVHAHFGLNLWPSLTVEAGVHAITLHGTDLAHPRSRMVSTAGLPFMDLVAPVSEPLRERLPKRWIRGRVEVLPCGVDLGRFRPVDRREARRALGLDEAGPYLLFAADPQRIEKRGDRARSVAGDVPLLVLKGVNPSQVPLWVNAANAVLVTSERESFGLATLEALACGVPVLSTPVGVAPEVLDGVEGTYCGRFDPTVWRDRLRPLLEAEDPRVDGRSAAARYSADRMAERVYGVWQELLGR
jgi:teichuronic acid biosynthesis glycosyltransferase TuaC